jgi:cob(I)alamin adenosyltransferase
MLRRAGEGDTISTTKNGGRPVFSWNRGMMNPANNRIVVLTGDGKGKTSSALGMALRAAGHGMKVAFVQFLKARADVGEVAALARFPEIDLVQTGCGFVPPASSPGFARHRAAAEAGLARVRERLASGGFDMVVLDEVCGAVSLGLLAESAVLETLDQARPGVILVLTGRDATPGLMARADTVSRIDAVKHAYEPGWPAQAGVEF